MINNSKNDVATKLTPKQEAFCQEFLKLGDKSAAYRQAYNTSNMKPETVNNNAYRLFDNSEITARIKQLQQEAQERNNVEIDEVISTLARMLRFDIADLYDEKGVLKDVKDMPADARLMIQSLDIDEIYAGKGKNKIGCSKKVRIVNKLDIIEKLMKHLGGYEKDNSQVGGNIQPIILNLGSGIAPEDESVLKLGNA